MPETREQESFLSQSGLTGRWWLVTKYTENVNGNRVASVKLDVTDAIEVALSERIKAVTDRVREGLRKPDRILHPMAEAEFWKTCACTPCDNYRAALRLLDQIDAELGGER